MGGNLRIIISIDWSLAGGVTIASINLCNAFNKRGYNCIMLGPHDWHLNKCNGQIGSLSDFSLDKSDIVISHRYLKYSRLNVKKHIKTIHEMVVYGNLEYVDMAHIINEKTTKELMGQLENVPYFIAPCIIDDLVPNRKPQDKIAGIIGRIDENKQTGISIRRALDDNFKKILVYGLAVDSWYWEEVKKEFYNEFKDNIIEYRGVSDDKQAMYDTVTDIYISSISETGPLVKAEAEKTGTVFHGNDQTNGLEYMDTDEIVKVWLKAMDIT